MAEQPKKTSDELAQERTDLALQRTVAAAERTLMAWIRTALSMISFGFTIYKFFQYLRESGDIVARGRGPRNLGLTLVALGTAALFVATLQHRQYLRRLGVPARQITYSLVFLVALLLALLGLLVFVSLLLRIGPF
jgi:putative membrane protein